MNTKILEYIIAIAEKKSITQAAEQFYLTQPVLSRHLKNLEKSLGTPLFVRQSHQMLLTEAGIIFVNNARAILHVEKQLNEQLEQMRQNQQESVTLLVEPYYLNFILKRVLPSFRSENPRCPVKILSADPAQARESLRKGEAAMAIFTAQPLPNPQFEYIPLFSDELLLVLPKDLPLPPPREDGRFDGSLLNDQVFCLHPAGSEFRALEDQWMKALEISPVTTLEDRSFAYSLDLVRRKQCCAFIPKGRLSDADRGSVQIVPTKSASPFLQVLAFPKNISFGPSARALAQTITAQYRHFARYMEEISRQQA